MELSDDKMLKYLLVFVFALLHYYTFWKLSNFFLFSVFGIHSDVSYFQHVGCWKESAV
jgi:hypothetical protein